MDCLIESICIITPVPDIINSYVQNSILKKIIERRMVQLKLLISEIMD